MIVNINGIRFDGKAQYLKVDAIPLEDPREQKSPSDARTNRFELSVRVDDNLKRLGINNIADITKVLSTPRAGQGGAAAQGGVPGQSSAPAQSGQNAAGAQVGIHLEHHWPGMYAGENPAVSDVQNLLRLQYLSGFRNSNSTP